MNFWRPDDAYVMFVVHNSSQKSTVLYCFFKQVKSVKFDHSLLLNDCLGMILYVILYQILLLVLQQNSPPDVSQTYEPFKSFGIPINLLMTKTTKKGDVIFLMNHQNGWLS